MRMKSSIEKKIVAVSDMLSNASRKKSLVLLSLLMFITSAVVYSHFIFGSRLFVYYDIGCDTKNIYYPIYCAIIQKLKAGDFSFWSFNFGMGANLMAYQSTIFDPFTILVCIAGLLLGTAQMAHVLVYVNIIKLLLAGYICYFYLSCFKLSESSKIIAAYIYAFNGFIMLWGQHYFFATACLLFPLLLLSIEKSLRNNKYNIMLAIVVAVSCIYSVYISYMMLLTAAVYIVLRLFQSHAESAKVFIFKLLHLSAFIIIGILISFAVFLPTVYNLLNVSNRIDSHSSLISTFASLFTSLFGKDSAGMDYYKSTLLRMISNNLQNPGEASYSYNNYYETIQLFFSVLFLVLLPQFVINIFTKGKRLSLKITTAIGLLLIFFVIVNPSGSFVINAFVAPTGRYSFLLMPPFALITASALNDIFEKKYFNVPVAVAVGVVFSFILGYVYNTGKTIHAVKVLTLIEAICLLFIIIILYQISHLKTRKLLSLSVLGLILFVGINVTFENYVTVNCRNFATGPSIASNSAFKTNGTSKVIDYINKTESGFYRYDKVYYDWSFNDPLIENIRGVSNYNSTLNRNILEFITQAWPEYYVYPAVYNLEKGRANNVITSLVGVKYIMSVNPIVQPNYQLIGKFNDIYLYKNNDALPFGMLYHNITVESQLSGLTSQQRDRSIFVAPVIDDKSAKILTYGQLLSNMPMKQPKLSNDVGLQNAVAGNETMKVTSMVGSSQIIGTLNSSRAGFLFMSLPYEQGWHLYVDGIEKTIIKTDYAFSGVELSPGTHTIKLSYELPEGKTGMLVSALGLMLLVVGAIIVTKSSRMHQMQ